VTNSNGTAGHEPRPQIGQLIPAAVGAVAILIAFAVRGTPDAPSPLAIFATVALVVAVVFGAAGAWLNRLGIAMRVSAWDVAVRTGYLALAGAALYVVQEIVVARLGGDAAARADELLALELVGLLVIALFVARLGVPGSRRAPGGGPRDSLSPLANARGVLYGLVTILVVLLLALVAFGAAPGATGLAAIGTGLAVSGGALALGALLGLLFGIPRSQGGTTDASEGAAAGAQRYKPNTNLEEISDWLTKIIVGVSLTQLGEIQARAFDVIGAVAKGFGGSDAAQAFSAGLLTTALVSGFLASYLVTRLYLRRALDEADRDEIVERVKAVAEHTAEMKVMEAAGAASASQADQSQADLTANQLATRQLDVGSPEVAAAELAAAFTAASPEARNYIFGIAQQQRSKYWASNKAEIVTGAGAGLATGEIVKMERTIPVFEALLEVDSTNPLIHGQLGFALKDRTDPDYVGAIRELSAAIDLRDQVGGTGSRFFEFNRALARIRLDQGSPEEILGDLCAAADVDFIREIIEKDPDTGRWLKSQKIQPAELRDHCAGPGTGEPTG